MDRRRRRAPPNSPASIRGGDPETCLLDARLQPRRHPGSAAGPQHFHRTPASHATVRGPLRRDRCGSQARSTRTSELARHRTPRRRVSPAALMVSHENHRDSGGIHECLRPFILLFPDTLYYVITTITFAPEDSVPLASTTADRLQYLCARAAHRSTEAGRSVCRTGVGSRCEACSPLGDSVAKWGFRRGARQGETTRYSTSITSADADIPAGPGVPLRSRGCARSGGSTGCESGAP